MTTLDPAHKATAQKAYDLLEIIYEVGGVDGSRISILQAMTLLAVVILTDDGAKHVTQEDIGGFLRKPQGPISQEIKKWVERAAEDLHAHSEGPRDADEAPERARQEGLDPMGIRQRGESSWEVNVAYRGTRRFATVASEAEAKAKEEEIRAELILAHRKATAPAETPVVTAAPVQQIVAPSWTLKEAITKTFEVQWNGTKSEKFYKDQTRYLTEYFGEDKRLSDITTEEMDKYRTHLRGKGNKQATINHKLAALSMVYKIAHQRGGVAMKPVMGIKRANRARVRWLSETEERTMLALLELRKKQDIHDWYVVLVDTGMRPQETRDMTGAWVDHRQGVIHVQISKTEAGIRAIPMTERVKAVLERRCLVHKLGKLFPYLWDRFTNQWDSMRVDMGLTQDKDFVPYCLRHTFGTRLIQRGVNVEVLQKLMGHEDIKQTMQYAKLGAAQFVAAIAKLEPVK
jgi:integrase